MADDKNKQLFLSLIYSFQMQTMMQLGKLANPMSGKIDRELDGAQVTIDMLDMLKAKTKGNIGDDEGKFLDQIIADLKLNYVEEREKDKNQSKVEDKKPTVDDGKKPTVDDGKKPTVDDGKKPTVNDGKKPTVDDGKELPVDDKKQTFSENKESNKKTDSKNTEDKKQTSNKGKENKEKNDPDQLTDSANALPPQE